MTLAERLQAELQAAIRAGREQRRDALRMVLATIHNAEKEARRPLADDEVVAILAREVKTRQESIEGFEKAGRPDLAAHERDAVVIIREFLPAELSTDELRALVLAAIEETGASSPRDLGRVMGVLAPRTRGRADGRAVSAMVSEELARAAVDPSSPA